MIETAELPEPKTVYFVSSEMFAPHTFTDEPSLFFGVSKRFAGEVHVHVSRYGYEAIAPAVHFQLRTVGKWSFGASGEYEFAHHSGAFAARVIAARSIGEGSLVMNVGNRGAYAIGFRPDMEAHTSWGIEAGREEAGEDHQVIFGVYTQPMKRLTIKAGAGAGFGSGRTSAVVRTGLVGRF